MKLTVEQMVDFVAENFDREFYVAKINDKGDVFYQIWKVQEVLVGDKVGIHGNHGYGGTTIAATDLSLTKKEALQKLKDSIAEKHASDNDALFRAVEGLRKEANESE